MKDKSNSHFLGGIKNILRLNFLRKRREKEIVVIEELQKVDKKTLSEFDFLREVLDALQIMKYSGRLNNYMSDERKRTALNKQVVEFTERVINFTKRYVRGMEKSVDYLSNNYKKLRVSLEPSQVKPLDDQLKEIKECEENIKMNSNNLSEYYPKLKREGLTDDTYKPLTSALNNILKNINSLKVYIPRFLKTIKVETENMR